MPTFACDMSAIPAPEREPHIALIREIFGSVREIREQDDGYSFRLAEDANLLTKSAAFIEKERLCCPFFGFSIRVEPEGGALWLSLTGAGGVKPFIKAEIGGALSEEVAREAGFHQQVEG